MERTQSADCSSGQSAQPVSRLLYSYVIYSCNCYLLVRWDVEGGKLYWRNYRCREKDFSGFWNICIVEPGDPTRLFQAHKLVLSACSPYFRHLFSNLPGQHPILLLKVHKAIIFSLSQLCCQEVPEDHISLLLEYMYCGYISVSQGSATLTIFTISLLQTKI